MTPMVALGVNLEMTFERIINTNRSNELAWSYICLIVIMNDGVDKPEW